MASCIFNKIIWIFICICATDIILIHSQTNDLVIEVGDLGRIRGINGTTVLTKRRYRQFLGIPYAKPPINESRFLRPEPTDVPLSTGIFDATSKMDCCPQLGLNIFCFRQSENCLGMHIFTPGVDEITNPLPVVVFLHGGAFSLGSGDSYTGARLLERDIIVVSPNYRLGVLGFFSVDSDNAPGNAAMYDLHQALVWVKKYIQYFGGDPNSITIAGQSAGSVAVIHLMSSPLTRDAGLFHRAIALSGTVLNEWGTTTAEVAEEASLQVASLVNCHVMGDPFYNPDTVAACMRYVPFDQLVDALDKYQRAERLQGRLGFSPVTPIVQKRGDGIKFLDKSPEDILEQHEQSNIPLIMGSTRHDGSFVLGVVFNQYLKLQDLQNNATFLKTSMLPTLLQALGIHDRTEAVYDSLGYIYLGDDSKESGNFTMMIPGLIDLHSVFFFKAAEYRTLKLHSRIQPNSYWYTFDFKGTKSVYEDMVNPIGNPVPGGVTHGDDLIYLFDVPLKTLTRADELYVSKRMVDFWGNFITTGDPNSGARVSWPTFSETSPSYIIIKDQDDIMNDFPNKHWQGLSTELMPDVFPLPATTTRATTLPTTTTVGVINEPETTPNSALLVVNKTFLLVFGFLAFLTRFY